MEFFRNVVIYEDNIPHYDDPPLRKLRSRPSEPKSAPYNITTATCASRGNNWRRGQLIITATFATSMRAANVAVVLNYCNANLPIWHDSGDPDGAMLLCHTTYWRTLQRDDGTPCRLAEWCHLLISNREQNQSRKRWAVHITACILDRTYELIPAEECYGIRLDDGTAFGPGRERVLFDSLDKYMGGHEIARYIFETGVPRK